MAKNSFDKSALLIVNPVSGKKAVFKFLPQIIRRFMDEGYIVTTMVTGGHGDAEEFAAKYGPEYDLICCTGGDGTLNQTLSGIAKAGLNVPLGYIPCGSTNDFALAHGLSSDIMQAAERILTADCSTYDIGRFGDRYFSYVAAFGAFSWLSYTTDQNLKNLLGHTAYVLSGISELSQIRKEHVRMEIDGEVVEDDFLFGAISNSTSVGGVLTLDPRRVDLKDGKFELLLVRVPKDMTELSECITALRNQEYDCKVITFRSVSRLTVYPEPGMAWTLDGEKDDGGEEIRIENLTKAIRLIRREDRK